MFVEFVKFVYDPNHQEHEITVELQPNWLDLLLGDTKVQKTYVGSGTIWHEETTGAYASSRMARFLSEREWALVREIKKKAKANG